MYDTEENKARTALLAHYSAKTTAQTQVLVGLAVAFFADIQAYNVLKGFNLPFELDKVFLAASIITIMFLIAYAIGRLVYYGELSDAVLSVKRKGSCETKKWIENDFKVRRVTNAEPEVTYLNSLVYAIHNYLEDRMAHPPIHVRIFSCTNSKWFWRAYTFAMIALALVVFHLWLLSV